MIDRTPTPWTGRNDGPGTEHERWYNRVTLWDSPADQLPILGAQAPATTVILGFASDEGVERNQGRTGAAQGPDAIRRALATCATGSAHAGLHLADAGDIAVTDGNLEAGHDRLGSAVASVLDAGAFPLVFGGGHEIAYGTYRGLATSNLRHRDGKSATIGILNLDAHFDLRTAPRPSSGTPFRQALNAEHAAGTNLTYAVLGIAQPSNTQTLFDAAHHYGVPYLLDEDCQPSNLATVTAFVDRLLASIDLLYLTVDLDVLPAHQAPGVSAPAAYGVPLETILAVTRQVAVSGKLAVADIAELNPEIDIDARTAKTAARIAHTILTHRRPLAQ